MNSKLRFKDKVVIITGASSGLGLALAKAFAQEGAVPVLVARSADKLREVSEEIRQTQPRTLAVPADVSVRTAVDNVVKQVEAEFGRIDILVNNAGNAYGGFIEGSEFTDDLRKMLDVSLVGKIYAAQAVLPGMKKRHAGHIVNISSVLGRKAFPHLGAYSMVMHAISAFSDALRQELRGTGVSVTCVHPALMRSALFERVAADDLPPQFKAMTPLAVEVVAGEILSAVHKKSARLIVPWQPWLLLFADTLSPYFGDFVVRLLARRAVTRLLGL